MKRLFLLLSLTLILVLVVAGCTSADQAGTTPGDESLQEATPAAGAIDTPVVEEPGAMATQESGTVLEEPAAEAPAATEEPLAEAPAVTEEPLAEAPAATEEPLAEAPAATEEPLAEAPAATEEPLAEAPSDETDVIPPTGAVDLNRMSNLLDFEVWNRNNEQIGTVNAIVIDKDASQIEYVIVGTGGLLGLGEKEIPVPWQVLKVEGAPDMEAESSASTDQTQATEPESNAEGDDTSQATEAESSAPADDTQIVETPQNVFILDLTQEELEQAPEFDLTPLYESQSADPAPLQTLEQEIQSFWQSDLSQSSTETSDEAVEADQTAGQVSGTKNFVLADNLLGATVRSETAGMIDETQQSTTDQATGDDTQQDLTQADTAPDLGTVEEIMVDVNTGNVSYLLVSLNPATSVEESPVDGAQEAPASGAQEPTASDDTTMIDVVPVPLEALEWNAEEAVLLYTGSEALEQAPTVNLDEIESDQSTSDWKSQADSFWGLEGSDSETQ